MYHQSGLPFVATRACHKIILAIERPEPKTYVFQEEGHRGPTSAAEESSDFTALIDRGRSTGRGTDMHRGSEA